MAFGIPTSKDDFMEDLRAENKDFAKTITGGWFHYKAFIINVLKEIEPLLKGLGLTIIHRITLSDLKEHFIDNRKCRVFILFSHWKEEQNHTQFEKKDYLEFLNRHPSFLETAVHSVELFEWLIKKRNRFQSLAEAKISKHKMLNEVPLVEIREGKIYANYDGIIDRHLDEISPEAYLEILKHSTTSKVEFYDGLKGLYEIVQQIPVDFHNLLDLTVCQSGDLVKAMTKSRPNCHIKYKLDVFEDGNGKTVNANIMLHFYKILFKHLNRIRLTYFDAYREVALGLYKLLKDFVLP